MKTEAKIIELKAAISRYDHYYANMNSKSSLYLSINTALSGLLLVYWHEQHYVWFSEPLPLIMLTITVLSNITGLVFNLWVMKPYLKESKRKSVISFVSVSLRTHDQLTKDWDGLTEDSLYVDYLNQYELLAKGLRSKYRLLSFATWAIFIQVALIFIFSLTLIHSV